MLHSMPSRSSNYIIFRQGFWKAQKRYYSWHRDSYRFLSHNGHSFSTSPPSDSTSPLYRIAKIGKDGNVKYTSVTISDILRGSSMHVRDLFSLNLTPTRTTTSSYHDDNDDSSSKASSTRISSTRKNGERLSSRPSAAILPREDDIIVSFGTIRALIGIDSGIIFDAHKPTVQLLADDISQTFQRINTQNQEEEEEEEEEIKQKDITIIDNQYSFELVFIEKILRDVSDTYSRRLKIYEPILDSILSKVTNEMFSATVVHRIMPIKDSILEFEIHVQSALDSLKDLLTNDEDMVGLLLTKKKQARDKGYDLDLSSHEDAELLIEEYARRLNTVLNETRVLLKKVKSKQVRLYTLYLYRIC